MRNHAKSNFQVENSEKRSRKASMSYGERQLVTYPHSFAADRPAATSGGGSHRTASMHPKKNMKDSRVPVSSSRVTNPMKTSTSRKDEGHVSRSLRYLKVLAIGVFTAAYLALVAYLGVQLMAMKATAERDSQSSACMALRCSRDTVCLKDAQVSRCSATSYQNMKTAELVLGMVLGIPAVICVPCTLQWLVKKSVTTLYKRCVELQRMQRLFSANRPQPPSKQHATNGDNLDLVLDIEEDKSKGREHKTDADADKDTGNSDCPANKLFAVLKRGESFQSKTNSGNEPTASGANMVYSGAGGHSSSVLGDGVVDKSRASPAHGDKPFQPPADTPLAPPDETDEMLGTFFGKASPVINEAGLNNHAHAPRRDVEDFFQKPLHHPSSPQARVPGLRHYRPAKGRSARPVERKVTAYAQVGHPGAAQKKNMSKRPEAALPLVRDSAPGRLRESKNAAGEVSKAGHTNVSEGLSMFFTTLRREDDTTCAAGGQKKSVDKNNGCTGHSQESDSQDTDEEEEEEEEGEASPDFFAYARCVAKCHGSGSAAEDIAHDIDDDSASGVSAGSADSMMDVPLSFHADLFHPPLNKTS